MFLVKRVISIKLINQSLCLSLNKEEMECKLIGSFLQLSVSSHHYILLINYYTETYSLYESKSQ